MADYAGLKMKMLGAFVVLGVASTALMVFIGEGDWKLAIGLFVVSNIAVTGILVFYESLLPHVAREDERDMLCSTGFALGYLGGGLLLAVNLFWIQKLELFGLSGAAMATRLSFLSVALWWVGFSIPIFKNVREPERRLEADERASESPFRVAFNRLGETFGEVRTYKHAFLLLLAFTIYNDGILTIIRMATSYGTELGLAQDVLISALLITQVVGIPFAIFLGYLARWDHRQAGDLSRPRRLRRDQHRRVPTRDRGRLLPPCRRRGARYRVEARRSAARCSRTSSRATSRPSSSPSSESSTSSPGSSGRRSSASPSC
jgi:UMF1 family MFS transporter